MFYSSPHHPLSTTSAHPPRWTCAIALHRPAGKPNACLTWLLAIALACPCALAFAHRPRSLLHDPPALEPPTSALRSPVPTAQLRPGHEPAPGDSPDTAVSGLRARGAKRARDRQDAPPGTTGQEPIAASPIVTGDSADADAAEHSDVRSSAAAHLPDRVSDTAIGGVWRTSARGLIPDNNRSPPTSATATASPASFVLIVGNCRACAFAAAAGTRRQALDYTAFAGEIAAAAQTYGVDEWLVRAVIHAESGYDPDAISNKGAEGLMQLMPATAARFGVRNPFDVGDNIRGGVRYLAYLSRRYGGNIDLIAAAYNAGENNVDRYGGVPPFAQTQTYVRKVAALARRYRDPD